MHQGYDMDAVSLSSSDEDPEPAMPRRTDSSTNFGKYSFKQTELYDFIGWFI